MINETKSKAELSTFIESNWQYSGSVLNDLILFPDGTFNIFFAQSAFSIKGSRKEFNSGVYLAPISSYPIQISTQGEVHGIRFKVFSLNNILGKNKKGLERINNMLELYHDSKAIAHFSSLIQMEKDPERINDLLELIGFELLNRDYRVNVSLRDKVNFILDRKGQINVSQMSSIFGVSRQGLYKSFKQNLSITPKELASIWQLNHFFTLCDNPNDSLTGMSLDAGYYDQAHFNNHFKSVFGLTPSFFMETNASVITFARESMIKRFNNYYDPEV